MKHVIPKIIFIASILCFVLFSIAPAYAYSDTNTYVSLSGTNLISVQDSDNLDGFSSATWNIWVKQNSYIDKAGLIGKYAPRPNGRSYLIRTALDSSISFVISGDGTNFETQTSTSKYQCGIRNNDEWTMITVAYDGSTITYYRNGIRCSVDYTGISQIFNSNQSLTLGSENDVNFNGSIDDVKIYDVALDKRQVARLYDESVHGRNMGQSVTTLLYYQIEEEAITRDIVTPENFAQQMQYIYDKGYTAITTKEFNDWQKGNFTLPEKPVMIVFDDGWETVKTVGFPILDAFGLKASIAIVSNYADGTLGSDYMNWSELSELLDAGWRMGSHSVSHIGMTTLNETDFRNELTVSKQKIEENLGVSPDSFVFPFHLSSVEYTSICGEYYDLCWTRGEKATVPRYNYKTSNGHDYGWIDPVTGLKRITIANSTTIEEFESIFSREDRLISEWNIEEGSGNLIEDKFGENDAALSEGAVWISG